jgi:dihydroxyacid dehydratase/phosphogluconate dehydratase
VAGWRSRWSPPGGRPSSVLSRGAFLNAIVALAAIGGSTNAVVHLLAIAGRAAWTCRWTTST